MAYSITCPKCRKINQPYIELPSENIFCSECETDLTSIVTVFVKNQIKQNKQYRKKKNTPFSVKCPSCNKEDQPIIKNKKAVCKNCLKPLTNLTHVFTLSLIEYLKTKND